MDTVSVAQAKAKLSAILDKVEHGAEVVITRHGKPVAKVTSIPSAKKPLKSLADFRGRMRRWRKPSAKLLRAMREEGL